MEITRRFLYKVEIITLKLEINMLCLQASIDYTVRGKRNSTRAFRFKLAASKGGNGKAEDQARRLLGE